MHMPVPNNMTAAGRRSLLKNSPIIQVEFAEIHMTTAALW